jgi:4,5-dihydroxyphthalate decarboxylase
MTMAMELTIAIGNYDRVRPLRTGEVSPEGVDLTLVDRPPGELFKQVVEHRQFELTEMSLSTYTIWTSTGECPYVGIPVFPSRFFRHSAIYVNSDSGIDEPTDLRGKDVGVLPEYQITAATMVRGLLADEYGVDPEEMMWHAAREEKLPVKLTPGLEKHVIPPEADLEEMLVAGDIDALVSTLIPEALGDGVERLFPDFKDREMAYYEQTGIFPIMHTLVVRKDIYESNPWVVNSVYEAMRRAKKLALQRLYNTDALAVTLPWLIDHIEEVRDALGSEFWPYGFRPNRNAIDALTRYSHEQGLSRRRIEPEELFVEDLLETGAEGGTRVKPGDR